jgi:ArsR family metal-binding transcriptional regulator
MGSGAYFGMEQSVFRPILTSIVVFDKAALEAAAGTMVDHKKYRIRRPTDMLIENYDLEVYTPACDPGSVSFAARARLTADISDVLPYLNASWQGAIYYPAANALTWKKDGHSLAIHPYEILVSNLEDRESAGQVMQELIDLVNQTWERRGEITPDTSMRQRPTPMAIYKLLPNTYCKKCGEATCYSFALKLAAAQKKLADCPLLFEAKYADNLVQLEAIVL